LTDPALGRTVLIADVRGPALSPGQAILNNNPRASARPDKE
jgi:hypothetical protein